MYPFRDLQSFFLYDVSSEIHFFFSKELACSPIQLLQRI